MQAPINRDYSAGFLSVINSSFAFVIENENTSADPFVSVSMHEAFMEGNFHQVPILIGFTSEEAIHWVKQGGTYNSNILNIQQICLINYSIFFIMLYNEHCSCY